MQFDAVLLAPRRAQMRSQGWWRDTTINDALDQAAQQWPDRLALVGQRTGEGAAQSFNYAQLARMADRVAIGLWRLGVRPADVVACQLPNVWQFTVLYLACARIGAVFNPLMPIFRERELLFMLGHGEAKLIVVLKDFRNLDYEAMLKGIQPQLPQLQHVVAIGAAGADSFEALLTQPAWERDADAAQILGRHRILPDAITQLIYTSGTTGEPKGVMHSSNTLMANIHAYAERLALGGDDVVLMASPMAHQTGFMYGLMMPVMLGATAVLLDVWNAATAAQLIRRWRCSFTMASTPFLSDLSREVATSGAVPSLRTFLCAGAPIPGPLVEQAQAALGAQIISAWGMSENGAVTTTLPGDDAQRAVETDGLPLPGAEVKVLDDLGQERPRGEIGQLWVRANSNFGGYLKRPQLNATTDDGWFDTGDQARIDAQGYIRITGRSKDVIIRGGENIPVVEVEALLYKHPAVAQAAVVAYADERLGERACAVIVLKPGAAEPALADVTDFLRVQKLAPHYLPERLVVLPEMPATPSGKIQKFKLREQMKSALPKLDRVGRAR
ncbi:cyclohexanecarboxylate-CoA ligase [Comamonas piscis]|uniref:Cyclohexanecarboxylate-CoA ligase n=1 Tax=Comamonas piscis TaxID=1562974 RepID=A0A7G5ELK3_9BURK|nr:cyclohexanecarboxylate-CoA ligase [Comamonas piscis]QMV74878.1 cyclohexanecarboxylate-CoA ligase [Comamonas piscis]WSO33355.1 cyclohexanecarboxylate-CoA ligase [Comamonas piscis]